MFRSCSYRCQASRLIVVVTLIVALGLAACDGGSTSSQPAMAASMLQQRDAFIGPAGQKKIGSYVWVWHTVPVIGSALVEADCPVNYMAISGGYRGKPTLGYESYPNQAFTGWIVKAWVEGSRSLSATVYASCVPAR